MNRWCVILAAAGCWMIESPLAVFADPFSECMKTGRGTYMEGHWDLVEESGRLIVCRDQETDRQRADRTMKAWEEEQRRLREATSNQKAQGEQGAAAKNGEPTPEHGEPQARGASDAQLPPCDRPDSVGECQATPDQILYQIKRSRQTGGQTPK